VLDEAEAEELLAEAEAEGETELLVVSTSHHAGISDLSRTHLWPCSTSK
jgi:predicted GTPase